MTLPMSHSASQPQLPPTRNATSPPSRDSERSGLSSQRHHRSNSNVSHGSEDEDEEEITPRPWRGLARGRPPLSVAMEAAASLARSQHTVPTDQDLAHSAEIVNALLSASMRKSATTATAAPAAAAAGSLADSSAKAAPGSDAVLGQTRILSSKTTAILAAAGLPLDAPAVASLPAEKYWIQSLSPDAPAFDTWHSTTASAASAAAVRSFFVSLFARLLFDQFVLCSTLVCIRSRTFPVKQLCHRLHRLP